MSLSDVLDSNASELYRTTMNVQHIKYILDRLYVLRLGVQADTGIVIVQCELCRVAGASFDPCADT